MKEKKSKPPQQISQLKTESKLFTQGVPHVKHFSCGAPALDTYLQEQAHKYQQKGDGVTTLVVDCDRDQLVGYYTLTASSISLIKGQKMLPAISIDMFAINNCYRNTVIEEYCN